MRCDFHLHTTMSDGRVTPEALVFKASARDLDLIAVTDHDTTAGVAAAQEEGRAYGVRVLSGVELSTEVSVRGEESPRSIHLICLAFDVRDRALQDLLASVREARRRATRETAERLALAGYSVELAPGAADRSVCRPHVADALVKAGHARSRQNAFDRFLSGEAYRSHYALPSADEAIRVVHAAGGIAIYAHPFMEDVDVVTPRLVDAGLDGIEVHRASWPRSPRPLYVEEWARHTGLMVSGGSDWHGNGSLGQLALTRDEVGRLIERVA